MALVALALAGCSRGETDGAPPPTDLEPQLAARGLLLQDFEVQAVTASAGTTYRLSYHGVPLAGVGAKKRGGDAEPLMPSFRYAPTADPETTPRVSADAACAAVLADLPESVRSVGATLELAPLEDLRPLHPLPEGRAPNTDDFERVVTGFRLRHRCVFAEPIAGTAAEQRWIALVDAASGELIDLRTDGNDLFVPATGHGYFSGTRPIIVLEDQDFTILEDANLNFFATPGSNAPGFVSTDDSWGDGQLFDPNSSTHSANGETAAVDAYDAVQLTWNMFLDVFDRQGTGDLNDPVDIFVHAQSTTAHFNRTVPPASYRASVVIGYAKLTPDPVTKRLTPLVTTDIVAHELGHFFFDSQVYPGQTPLDLPQTEASGLNEATADIVGFLTELYRDATRSATPIDIDAVIPQASNFTIGEGAFPTPRSMLSPQEPVWRPGLTLNNPPEVIGGPIDRMFLLMAYGCRPPPPICLVCPPFPWSCGGGVTSTGLKPRGAAAIWGCTVANLSPGATFFDARDLAMGCARALDSHYGGPRTIAVADAFFGINVGLPADTKPPTATLSCHQDSHFIECTGSVQDAENPGQFDVPPQLAIDGVDQAVPIGWSFTIDLPTDGLQSGAHTVTLTAYDLWRNRVQVSTSVTLDLTPPTITAFQILNPYVITSIHPIHVAATDSAGVAYAAITVLRNGVWQTLWSARFISLGGGPGAIDLTPPVVFPADLADGTYPLELEVYDPWGNLGVAKTSLTVDRLPPSPCAILSLPAYVSPSFVVTAQANDATSGVAEMDFLYDGANVGAAYPNKPPGQLATAVWAKTGATVGPHTLALRCVDHFGNATQSSNSTVTVDLPPSVTVTIYGQVLQTTYAVVYRLTAFDSDGLSLVSSYMSCSTTGTHSTPPMTTGYPTLYDRTFTVGAVVLGETCRITLYAVDRFGIAATTQTIPFVIVGPQQTGPACNADVHSDVTGPFNVSVGKASGVFDLQRNTYLEPDQITVSCAGSGTVNGQASFSPGCEGTQGWVSTPVTFSCSTSQIRVQVTPDCGGPNQSDWDFVIGCAH